MKLKYIKKNKPTDHRLHATSYGFTLIELMVVLFITTMIAGISVANFRAAEKQKQAVIAGDTVVNAIRNAQNFTLTGKNTNNTDATCRVPQYYYITFNYSGAIVLSAVHNNNSAGTCSSAPDTIETYPLPINTRIKASGLVLDGAIASSSISFMFMPPFGVLTAGKDIGTINATTTAAFTTATISVETLEGSASKTVTIDGIAGKIQ
ncbi:MAG: type II secretion system protein [Candidatus Doudnabacteria bacterium]